MNAFFGAVVVGMMAVAFSAAEVCGAEQGESRGVEGLRRELAESQLRYKAGHPEIERARKEVAKQQKTDYGVKLERAKAELATLRLKYKEGHPALVEAKNKVAILERVTESGKVSQAKAKEQGKVEAARTKLASLRLKYKDAHPSVVEAKNRIAVLEKAAASGAYGSRVKN